MPAFIDSICPKCKASIGWYGEMKDHPGCLCGWKPDMEELLASQEKMEEHRRMSRTPHTFEPLDKATKYCKLCGQHQNRGPHA